MSRWHLLAVSLLVAACSNSNDGSNQAVPDARPIVCGDGICAASEVNTCTADCGAGPNSGCSGGHPDGDCQRDLGETADNCRDDCEGSHPQPDAGTNPVDAGTNPTDGGSSTLNCQDPTTLINCFICLGGGGCNGVTETDCNACLGGGGLSLCDGGAADGTCESDEDSTTCPEDCGAEMCDGGAPDGTCESDETITTCPDDCF